MIPTKLLPSEKLSVTMHGVKINEILTYLQAKEEASVCKECGMHDYSHIPGCGKLDKVIAEIKEASKGECLKCGKPVRSGSIKEVCVCPERKDLIEKTNKRWREKGTKVVAKYRRQISSVDWEVLLSDLLEDKESV